jgi:hypothetical protein
VPDDRARLHPEVAALLREDGLDALFAERSLAAAEIFDELVNAACWQILEMVGRLPSKEGDSEASVRDES